MKLGNNPQKMDWECQVLEKLLDFITGNFFVEREDIKLDESLVDAGIIDSIGLIRIINFIENEFSIAFEDADMTKENLGSVMKIAAFICRKTGENS